jgi:hypothetical protein
MAEQLLGSVPGVRYSRVVVLLSNKYIMMIYSHALLISIIYNMFKAMLLIHLTQSSLINIEKSFEFMNLIM